VQQPSKLDRVIANQRRHEAGRGSKEGYLAKVQAATQQRVAERYLLSEDAERLLNEAKQRDLGF